MKNYLLNFLLLLIFTNAFAQTVYENPNDFTDTTNKKSIPAICKLIVNNAAFTIEYHSPAARNRVIWGGLVPYGDVWVTGAHSATKVTFPVDVMIGDTKVLKGSYALFTIPQKDKWTIIINKNFDQHLAWDYQQAEDIVRVEVQPVIADHRERLQYYLHQKDKKTIQLSIRWEKLEVGLPIILL